MLYRAKTRRRGAEIYIESLYRRHALWERAFFVRKISGGEDVDPNPKSRRWMIKVKPIIKEGDQDASSGRNDGYNELRKNF